MFNITLLEEYYKKYSKNLNKWLPEGLLLVDLDVLQKYDLLNFHHQKPEPQLTQYFHVVESPEKIILVNDQFSVWIVPENLEGHPCTYVLIAINREDHPHLEMGFQTQGCLQHISISIKALRKIHL